MKKIDKQTTIGYLGPQGTYSFHAAQKLFGKYHPKLLAQQTLYDIFEKVAEKHLDFGVVPAENSTEGTVRETLDYLVDFNLQINGSLDLPIHLNLLAKEKNQETITKVLAHPQALAQCRQWLRKRVPQAKQEETTSNMMGLHTIERERNVALIGSKEAAKKYSLHVLAENIQDNPQNTTRFYIISRHKAYEGAQKTILCITIRNRVGILRDILTVFGDFGINLNKIESRPSKEKNWDYYFFIEIDKAPIDKATIKALDLLGQYCQTIKILGGI